MNIKEQFPLLLTEYMMCLLRRGASEEVEVAFLSFHDGVLFLLEMTCLTHFRSVTHHIAVPSC
jgi:hypothetical protein